jgi:hypothetical protein
VLYRPAVGVVPATDIWMVLGGIPAESPWVRGCHTHERQSGLDERNYGVSGAGPELSERVEVVRAALPDANQARFEQDLD